MEHDRDRELTISPSDFHFVRTCLALRSAISLTDDKEYLVINRLQPLLRRHRIKSLNQLVMRLRMKADDPLWDEIVDALTTNETSFFRDEAPFRVLEKTILPSIFSQSDASTRMVNIWSAGCSSGQEAYSIAMLAMEKTPLVAGRLRIIGSDVSASMLRQATDGRYSPLEMARGISDARRRTFFEQSGTEWRVKNELRNLVRWERFSLGDAWPNLPLFDLVLLRNVLVYFDKASRDGILKRVHKIMRPGGILLLGSAESMMLFDHSFQPVTASGATYYVAK